MSLQALRNAPSMRETVSQVEWQTRLELAAAHRLMHHFGIGDLAHNHLCARVPGEPDAFLIKPAEALFDEVSASTLVKYDFDGNPRQDGAEPLRGGGLIIHAGLFQARADIHATIHTHTGAIMGVASQTHGLLPINQHAMHFDGRVAYHDFDGFEFDMRQRAPLIRDLGDKMIALLRNHGSLVCGRSIGEAFVEHHVLETACQGQIAALSAGIDNVVLISSESRTYARGQLEAGHDRRANGGKDWEACLRLAGRLFPEYRD
jgi:ribulose-5-phosphate 4-epimerase/fuculose-1-phosphate aldolase